LQLGRVAPKQSQTCGKTSQKWWIRRLNKFNNYFTLSILKRKKIPARTLDSFFPAVSQKEEKNKIELKKVQKINLPE
jgi:hypothetical protein